MREIHALETLDEQHMEIYARTDADDAGKVTKPQEEEDLACFVRLLAEQIPAMEQYRAMDRFYLGYIIPQIGKEFDLLKFGKELCVNIEIKNNGKPETILRQLLRNRYYLRAIDCPCVLYSFAAADRKLYMLKEDTLQDGSWEELAEYICRIREYPESSPDLLFRPGRFLISPIYTPLRFLNGEYFLTTHQEAICNDILRGSGKHCCIEGKAGTGKTLLLYHLYQKLCAAGENGRNGVCMVTCRWQRRTG